MVSSLLFNLGQQIELLLKKTKSRVQWNPPHTRLNVVNSKTLSMSNLCFHNQKHLHHGLVITRACQTRSWWESTPNPLRLLVVLVLMEATSKRPKHRQDRLPWFLFPGRTLFTPGLKNFSLFSTLIPGICPPRRSMGNADTKGIITISWEGTAKTTKEP